MGIGEKEAGSFLPSRLEDVVKEAEDRRSFQRGTWRGEPSKSPSVTRDLCKVCGSEGVLRERAQEKAYDGVEETRKHTQ